MKLIDDIMRVERKRYVSFGDFSVTDLISPVRLVRLRKRYGSTVIEDPMSVFAALLGTFIHEGIEARLKVVQHLDPGYVIERTVNDIIAHTHPDTGAIKDYLISGRFDILYLQDDGIEMTDVKTCSVWKKVFDPHLTEWTLQQNIYRNLLHARGIEVDKCKVFVIYKDWQGANALRDKSYPQTPFEEIELDVMDHDTTRLKLMELFLAHVQHVDTPDDDLPECSAEDRWERFTGGAQKEYALFKNPKSKRATKIIRTSLQDAIVHAQNNKGFSTDSVIEIRHAVRKRCETYCKVNKYCNHYNEYMTKKKSTGGLNEIFELKGVL